MRALDQVPLEPDAARLAEALMAAAAVELTRPADTGGLQPAGIQVRAGRAGVGRVRSWLPSEGRLVVLAGFGTACWLGGPDEPGPDLGRLACRSAATWTAAVESSWTVG